jgi:F-type H+-transporting ATPase subunit epsilon
MMQLVVTTPAAVVLDQPVDHIEAEATDGSFTILPRHIGFAAPLVPGILEYRVGTEAGFLAIDGGLLVKQGDVVSVATQRAVAGSNVLALQHALRVESEALTSGEARARSALARLETDAIRRLIEVAGRD